MHRTKVENMHKKVQIIKQYDNILKEMDRQLERDKMGNKTVCNKASSVGDSRAFYVTEITSKKQEFEDKLVQLSPKKKRSSVTGAQINSIKERLEGYER